MRALSLGIAVGLTLTVASLARAADRVCAGCGCTRCLIPVCVPKKIEKEITKTCWDVKCEDVCVPGCSELCGERCKQDECGCWTYGIWKPGCAYVKTRRVPVKTEVKRKVPSFEWTVEYRCPACCCRRNCRSPDESAAPAPEEAAAGESSRAQAAAEVAELEPIEQN